MSASSHKGNWLIFFIYAVFKHINEEIKNGLSLVQEIKKLFLCSRLTNLFEHIEVFDAITSLLRHTIL